MPVIAHLWLRTGPRSLWGTATRGLQMTARTSTKLTTAWQPTTTSSTCSSTDRWRHRLRAPMMTLIDPCLRLQVIGSLLDRRFRKLARRSERHRCWTSTHQFSHEAKLFIRNNWLDVILFYGSVSEAAQLFPVKLNVNFNEAKKTRQFCNKI